MRTRVLTVSSLMRETGRRSIEVPFIRLVGRWVEEAGFRPGDSIQIQVEYGRLVILKLSEEGEQVELGHDPSEFSFVRELCDQKPRGEEEYIS